MQERLQQRLAALRREFATGQSRLQDLETQQTRLRETLLRIAGAVQVLEELLAEAPATVSATPAPDTAPGGPDGAARTSR